ncbi:MAG TPA: DNA adenine methylase [Symbiobacteriaceae bacterium]
MTAAAPAARRKPLYVWNRKYIGSKSELLHFIAGVVKARAPEARHVADLFCGSGVVAYYFASQGFQVTAGDNLYHNYLAARCFFGGRPGEISWTEVAQRLDWLQKLPPVEGYCYREYGGRYFTPENAGRIDAIREEVARWEAAGEIGEQMKAVLLTSLLYGADKVANTCGQYDAYLKHLGKPSYSPEGAHLVDAMVYKPLSLGMPQVVETDRSQVFCGDANRIGPTIECDVLYLDPPYNTRQYVDNYHVLENIARWEKPVLTGKTRKFQREHLKSAYSRRRDAAPSLAALIRSARCRHILLSYNNEGIISDQEIVAMLQERGPVEIFTHPYTIFGNGAGRSGRRPIQERLFYCRVIRPPRDGA